jgi:hypothetical protein
MLFRVQVIMWLWHQTISDTSIKRCNINTSSFIFCHQLQGLITTIYAIYDIVPRERWIVVYIGGTNIIPNDFNPLNMTIVSNDPSWWPQIIAFRGVSYFQGSWRAGGLTQSLTVISQLHP